MTIINAQTRFIQPQERKKLKLKFERPVERDDTPPKDAA